MKAYLIGQVNIIDTEAYEDYKKSTAPLVKKYGGKFLIRGGNYEVVHGKWDYKTSLYSQLILYPHSACDALILMV